MRASWYRQQWIRRSITIILLLVISGGFLSTCVGQEEKSLFIVLYPHDSASETPLEENMVYEGTQYDVIVGYNHSFDDNSSDVGIANNVTVTVPWEVPYFINSFQPYIYGKDLQLNSRLDNRLKFF